MCIHVKLLTETFSANITSEWFLFGMGTHMPLQMSTAVATGITNWAVNRVQSGVIRHVTFECFLMYKLFVTNIALERKQTHIKDRSYYLKYV